MTTNFDLTVEGGPKRWNKKKHKKKNQPQTENRKIEKRNEKLIHIVEIDRINAGKWHDD